MIKHACLILLRGLELGEQGTRAEQSNAVGDCLLSLYLVLT